MYKTSNLPLTRAFENARDAHGQEVVLRFVYIGRLALATAILVAAVANWQAADPHSTLIATLAFVIAVFTSAASFAYSRYRPDTANDPSFAYLQVVFDLLLVTAVVHVTSEAAPSPLAPLYILVIAVSALILPSSGVLLTAALGDVLYLADSLSQRYGAYSSAIFVQIGIFGAVALGCGLIAAKLRRGEAARQQMAEELAAFRLREADVELLHTRAERLEAVAEMSASLAHEIKNPLASIRSAAELLAKKPSEEDLATLTTLLQRESDRLSRLLTEFLDFARTGMTRAQRLNLATTVRQVIAVLEKHPQKPDGVRLVPVFPSRDPVVVGDEDLLHRAIFNLVLNAMQASAPGGEVKIELAEIGRHQLPSQAAAFARGGVMLRVIDQGEGIAPQIRNRLFEPFVTTKPQGSGLGLSIVQRAIDSHHGFVLVDSGESGTTFSVILPKLGKDGDANV
jgi:signal transduction histidine kinase